MPPTQSNSPHNHCRQAAIHIGQILHQSGYIAYLAGGCVRDELLGLTPKDYDLATNATPTQVLQLFPKSQTVGQAFGVVLVRPPQKNAPSIEVATFRQDAAYSDNRRPDHISYSTPQQDAQRRDFTINGLFAWPASTSTPLQSDIPTSTLSNLHIIDYVQGLPDLQNRIIRAIGEPQHRFAEDYLRMLRAVRFASRLNFSIDPATAQAIQTYAPHLSRISRERIGQELRWMLQSPNHLHTLLLLHQLHLDGPILNQTSQSSPTLALSQSLSTLPASVLSNPACLPPHHLFSTCLAAWILDLSLPLHHDPQPYETLSFWLQQHLTPTIDRLRNALVLTNLDTDHLHHCLHLLAQFLHWPNLNLAQQKRLLAYPSAPAARLIFLAFSQIPTLLPSLQSLAAYTLADSQKLLDQQDFAPDPWITGTDLIAIGRKPGPDFRRILDKAYDLQLMNQFPTKQHALSWLQSLPTTPLT